MAVNPDIVSAVALLPSSVTLEYADGTNFLAYLNAIEGMSALGVTLSVKSSTNSACTLAGVVAYGVAPVIGDVVIGVNKNADDEGTATIALTVGLSQAALADIDIAAAVALIPDTLAMDYADGVNVLTVLNAITGMSALGVTLSVKSRTGSVCTLLGVVAYGADPVTGNVVVGVNKATGTEGTKTCALTVGVFSPAAARAAMPDRVTCAWMHSYIDSLPAHCKVRFLMLQQLNGIAIPDDKTKIAHSAQMEIFLDSF